jgi:hypothetical protein
MMQYDGQELVTLLWSLAQLHHQPGPEWLDIFCEAAQPQLPSMTGNQLSQLLWSFAQLRWTPPAAFLESHLCAVSDCTRTWIWWQPSLGVAMKVASCALFFLVTTVCMPLLRHAATALDLGL